MNIKKTSLALLASLIIHNVSACDACGCRPGSYAWGQLSSLRSNFIQFQSGYTLWSHESGSDALYRNQLGWTQGSVARWTFQIPVQTVIRKDSYDQDYYKTALGDASVDVWVPVLDHRDGLTDNVRWLLMAGGGLQIPTGKYMVRGFEKEMLSPHLQPGSGAYGFSLQAYATVLKNRWGAWIQINASGFTQNELGLRPGKQGQIQAQCYRELPLSHRMLMPQLGISLHAQTPNQTFGLIDEFSSGFWQNIQSSASLFGEQGYWQVGFTAPIWQKIPTGAPQQKPGFFLSWGHFLP